MFKSRGSATSTPIERGSELTVPPASTIALFDKVRKVFSSVAKSFSLALYPIVSPVSLLVNLHVPIRDAEDSNRLR